MPIKDDGVVEYVEIDGEMVPKIVVPAEITITNTETGQEYGSCLLYTSPSPRDRQKSRMPSSA